MKNGSTTHIATFRAAIRTVTKAARRRAFRKGLPVAISRNGKVVFVFKDKREVIATIESEGSKSETGVSDIHA